MALCRLDDPTRPVWCHTVVPDDAVDDRSFKDFVVADGVVLTTWQDDLVALRLKDGGVLWRRSLLEFGDRTYWPASPMALSGTTVLVDSNEALLAFDATNGKLRWQRPGLIWFPRTICEGVAYFTTPGREMYSPSQPVPSAVVAMDVRTGKEIARADALAGAFADAPAPLPIFTTAPAVGARHVFAVETGRIWAFDRKTLQPVWMTRPRDMGGPWTTPVAYGNRLLVKGGDGRLFCFEGLG